MYFLVQEIACPLPVYEMELSEICVSHITDSDGFNIFFRFRRFSV